MTDHRTPGAPKEGTGGPVSAQHPDASGARVALPDAPGWYASPAVGHWMPPDRCPHPDDAVFGPCDCRA